MNGKVKFFNQTKAFGFITGDDGKEYFVHQSALPPGLRLRDNDEVSFESEQGERGLKAVQVKKTGSGSPSPRREFNNRNSHDD
jgi:cold shock protein